MIIKSAAWYTCSQIYVPISAPAKTNHKKSPQVMRKCQLTVASHFSIYWCCPSHATV